MTTNPYSNFGPKWCESVIDDLNGTSFEVGIESDSKKRGSAVNVTVMDHDETLGLFVLQVRQSTFHPRRYTEVHKDYFLCGRNENGNAFAHPVSVIATNARVQVALCRIWDCVPSQLPRIVRQGDVALIPERSLTFQEVDASEIREFAVGSHIIRAGAVYTARGDDPRVFVAASITIRHDKSQHPAVETKLAAHKLYRVQLGVRANTWGFAHPTAD